MTRQQSVKQVHKAVDCDHPHCSKMPLQCARQPTAKGQLCRDFKIEEWRCVINAPAAGYHYRHSYNIYPMRYAYDARMDKYRAALRMSMRCHSCPVSKLR